MKAVLISPATRRQDLCDGQLGADHHAVRDPPEASTPEDCTPWA